MQVDESEWTKGFSVLIRGTLEELVEFVYFVYDMNGDRSLTREELYHCKCLILFIWFYKVIELNYFIATLKSLDVAYTLAMVLMLTNWKNVNEIL